MIAQLLKERNLPDVLGLGGASKENWAAYRQKLVEMLALNEFGVTPQKPDKVVGEVIKVEGGDAFAGKATQWTLRIGFDTPQGFYSFPVIMVLPNAVKKAPVFVHIAFRPEVPNSYLPAEEIVDAGVGFVNIGYNDVTLDVDDGYASGIAAKYPRKEGDKTAWGKIGMWAFAASRVLDYLLTRDDVDADRVAVIGHSRLGKTALWCAAQDERFCMAVSNDSGCTGAALSRGKVGERVARINAAFPHWFSDAYKDYGDREDEMPFDQHFLLAAIAPRMLCVASAEQDQWADPVSEFLSCCAASPAYEMVCGSGFVGPDSIPSVPSEYMQGRITYHVRPGNHFLSRYDWAQFLKYFNAN